VQGGLPTRPIDGVQPIGRRSGTCETQAGAVGPGESNCQSAGAAPQPKGGGKTADQGRATGTTAPASAGRGRLLPQACRKVQGPPGRRAEGAIRGHRGHAASCTSRKRRTRPSARRTRPSARRTRPSARRTRPLARSTRPSARRTRPLARSTRPMARSINIHKYIRKTALGPTHSAPGP
jgi:hypothetical protein